MSIQDEVKAIASHIECEKPRITYNHKILDIYEGNLLDYIKMSLSKELSTQSYREMEARISPINILVKIIDKLSKIYQQSPSRSVVTGSDLDSELLSEYEDQFSINKIMNISNEFFNLYKYSLVEPFVHRGRPRLRAIPNDRFLVYSNDEVDPLTPTHIIIRLGTEKDKKSGLDLDFFRVYSEQNIYVIDSRGTLRQDKMLDNPEAVNPIGMIPFVYVNRSQIRLMPKADTDTMAMTKIIPILLSDLNYAIKFQAFSIMYGIDVDSANLVKSPNAFWDFKSDPTTDKKPEIGTIKTDVDIESVHAHIAFLLATWLQSRGIKPGAIGSLDVANSASGISKIVDEMDTAEERQKQVGIYKKAEDDLWHLVTQGLHPLWVARGEISERRLFSNDVAIEVKFAEQLPLVSRGQIVRDLRDEYEAGFTSKERVIHTLNPELSTKEIDELLIEIEQEHALPEIAPQPQLDSTNGANLDGMEQVRGTASQGTEQGRPN